MGKVKHNKIKNTGIIFEVITRQITSDILSNKDSKAVPILKKYFVNTELGKEYKLYDKLFNSKNLSESKATVILDTILESSKNLNRTKLKSEKYNLIKELKSNYNLDNLFRIKLSQYKKYASLYNLIEMYSLQDTSSNIEQIIDNKVVILEYLTNNKINTENSKNTLLEEFKSCDEDVRLTTYHILLERFNKKYESFNSNQKRILKEYINSVESTSQLKEFYNKEITNLKSLIENAIKNVDSETTKIKLVEVSSLMNVLGKKDKMKTDDIVDLLQYHSLVQELNNIKNV